MIFVFYSTATGQTQYHENPLNNLRTTDHRIYLSNLKSRLKGYKKSYVKKKLSKELQLSYARDLLLTGQLFHNSNYFSRANAIIDDWLKKNTLNRKEAIAIKAKGLNAMHNFRETVTVLQKQPKQNDETRLLLSEAYRKLNNNKKADSLYKSVKNKGTINYLSYKSHRAFVSGDYGEVIAYLDKISHDYKNSDPFMVSWIYSHLADAQYAMGHKELGDKYLKLGYARLPFWVVIAEKYANFCILNKNFVEAELIYKNILKNTSDPHILVLLADLYSKTDRLKKVARIRNKARSRYSKLILKYPALYTDEAKIYFDF